MKILFINGVLGGDFSALDISLVHLSSYLNEKTDHSAHIIDFVFHRKDWKRHLNKGIKKYKPDIIGMSCNTMYMQYVKSIIKEIREKYKVPVILGGYHVSLKPLETLKIPGVSAVCIGDGEYAIAEYLDRLEKGQSMKGVEGIWAKEKKGIIKNRGGCFLKNLDELPMPDWELWPDLKKYFYYLGMLYMIGSRGCPYKCIYCDAHQISDAVDGTYYRIRDPGKYAREINFQWDKYAKKGMRMAQLFDQVPTISTKWLSDFCQEYRKAGKPDEQKYSMYSRIDHLNEEKIRMLAKSGCAILRMGVESGSDFIRKDIYNKDIPIEKIKKIFRLCKKHGIAITAYYMVGGPAETRRTINQTISLARKLNASRSAFFVFKPFTHESEILIERYGGKIDEKRWKKADNITFDAVVKLKDISPGQVEWLQYKAYSLTFSKRLLWMFGNNPFKYTTRFSTYITKGLRDGLDINYLLPYYHIYGYDYVLK